MKTRIKQIAKEKSVKAADLAAMCGVTRRTVCYWYDGKISLDNAMTVANALGCSFYELFEPVDGMAFTYDEVGNFKGLSK